MFGCVGLCGDCFSTSPIPLLVKRFYCSFAIQSKERKERGGGGKSIVQSRSKENSTVTKNIGNILLSLASLRSERSQWLTKKHPSPSLQKGGPFCKNFFFKYCPVFKFFSCLFSYYWLYRDFQMFPAKTLFSFLKFRSLLQFFDFSSEALLFYCFCCPSIWEWGAAGE